jgi:dTDP-4-dehydrorhamnose reductase
MYLITGSNGQLGQALHAILGDEGIYVDRADLDICDLAQVEGFLEKHQPKFLINCAAYTAVDRAEGDEEQARLVNAIGPENLAKACARFDIPLIHVSTDYVFDGTNHRPYNEDEPTNPQSVYGVTKLAGEQSVLREAKTVAIVRTAWLYSTTGNNFVKTMQRLGRERGSLNVVADQIGSPTYAPDLAQALLAVAQELTPGTKEVFHFTNEGVASWYDFAVAIMELSQIDCTVTPIPSSAYPTPAKRPFYSVLNKAKIKEFSGITIRHWREALVDCLSNEVMCK